MTRELCDAFSWKNLCAYCLDVRTGSWGFLLYELHAYTRENISKNEKLAILILLFYVKVAGINLALI